jgi:putative ABC transport system permease protein
MRTVLGRTGALVGAGLAAGAVLSVWVAAAIQSLLHGPSVREHATLASAIIVLAAIALLSAGLPAWRASRVNPVVALRAE